MKMINANTNNIQHQKYQEEILEIINDFLPELKKIFKTKEIKIKNIKNFARKGHKKTFLNKNEFLKHYLLLDTGKIISIPVYAIKTKEKTLFKHIKIPIRRNIGIIEFSSRSNNNREVTIYAGNIKENYYY